MGHSCCLKRRSNSFLYIWPRSELTACCVADFSIAKKIFLLFHLRLDFLKDLLPLPSEDNFASSCSATLFFFRGICPLCYRPRNGHGRVSSTPDLLDILF